MKKYVSTVNGCIVRNDAEILLVKRSGNEKNFPNFWSLPGGTQENEETTEDCLNREIQEELGVDINNTVFFHSYTWKDDINNTLVKSSYFLGNIHEDIRINTQELSEYCWVNIFSEEINNYSLAFNQNSVIQDLKKYIIIYKPNHYTLRISVTSLCNLYCTYCNPDREVDINEMLSKKEMLDIGEIVANYGVKKISYTGGEPTIRKDIVDIVAGMKQRGITSQSMTTNGIIFHKIGEQLKEAGLTKVNMSLDTLDREKYKSICGYDGLDDVLKSIRKGMELFGTVKINCVLTNENFDEIGDFIEFANSFEHGECILRFLEVVPYDKQVSTEKNYISYDDIYNALNLVGIEEEVTSQYRKDVPKTRYFRLKGKRGVYSINPCASVDYACDKEKCTKLRLSPNGYLSNCTTQLKFARNLKGLSYKEKNSIISDMMYEKANRIYKGFQHKGKYYDFWRFGMKNKEVNTVLGITEAKKTLLFENNKIG